MVVTVVSNVEHSNIQQENSESKKNSHEESGV